MCKRADHLTFRGNLKATRYGWLRLTPAYSVHLVADLLAKNVGERKGARVLDPFCGTGTTALVCAEQGIACDTTDINPFLLWLARAKTTRYSARDRDAFDDAAGRVTRALRRSGGTSAWTPSLHQIEKWWPPATLASLARAMRAIRRADEDASRAAGDLLRVAFCRTMIECANVSFGHQSMSFKKGGAVIVDDDARVVDSWMRAVAAITEAAASPIGARPSPVLCDARDLHAALKSNRYDCVITSPPYPNRMSYIRELRPYMYWLGYLSDGRQAGELDWRAIGGTWGVATSNVAKWSPPARRDVAFDGFDAITSAIAKTSPLLARYVEKYFHDMTSHAESLFDVVAPGGSVHYVVGNSKFYDVVLPVEKIFAALFSSVGFRDVAIETIRKRTSKKELFEFVVSAKKSRR